MRLISIGFLLVLIAFTFVKCQLELATSCDPEACRLPECRCSSTNIPGGLAARDTPQFVVVSFDDGINVLNIEEYRATIYNRRNKLNNCPAGVTFFINHEYTDYSLVNELYNQGFEIALHSITHRTDQAYWREASYEDLMKEFNDQKTQIAHFANIPIDRIYGIRSPFLQMAGNATFQMLAQSNLRYDLSWPTIAHTNPGLWPYTLHYASIQDCIIPPCPTASIPGPWVLPFITWTDLEGFPCNLVDTCIYSPTDEEGWFKFLLDNFERHYHNNRAPFILSMHASIFTVHISMQRAFTRFLDTINNLNDVFMVNANEVIDWVQNPVPINEYAQQSCRSSPPAVCRASSCGPLRITDDHPMEYYMRVCNRCPRHYPWLDNPLGD
ncbi:unnamed protein product [Euphydryas editha]|uniref:NodB homology domain-containing protein n=1 Tax=Euphydryas editha TaxID=104508 RepID=A0AAU9UGL6_EUPED|nr:unnamed protein product [Euphydryas editha]